MDLLAMTQKMKPRLGFVDIEIAAMALADAEQHIPKLLGMISSEPTRLIQTRHTSLASDYESVAYFSYALGFPFESVKKALSNAAFAFLKVFEYRGAEPAFPAFSFQYDPAYPAGTPESTVEFTPLNTADDMDYSLTNSQQGCMAVCEAFAACEDALAERLATLIRDPPSASYIEPESFCTPDDQQLAYALRDLLSGTQINSELDRLAMSKTEESIGHQATMVRALAMNDADRFSDSLRALLRWHETQALSKTNQYDPECFICTTGLGLCRLACRRELCSVEDLPQGNLFLPLELIRTA